MFSEQEKPLGASANPVLIAVHAAFPQGPTRKASTRGVPAEQLNELALTIKDTFIFDCGDHWFYLFIGCAEINRPFELSLRIAKDHAEKSPPAWPIPVVGTIANDIAYGTPCILGTTWKVDGDLGDLLSPFCGVMALADLQFGQLAPIAVYQLVPITDAELLIQGDAKTELATRLSTSRARMLTQTRR